MSCRRYKAWFPETDTNAAKPRVSTTDLPDRTARTESGSARFIPVSKSCMAVRRMAGTRIQISSCVEAQYIGAAMLRHGFFYATLERKTRAANEYSGHFSNLEVKKR